MVGGYFVPDGPPPRVSGMPTPGGGGGGGGGGLEAGRGAVLGCGASVLTVPSAYRERTSQKRDLEEQGDAGDREPSGKALLFEPPHLCRTLEREPVGTHG